jgi:hypothetical protein
MKKIKAKYLMSIVFTCVMIFDFWLIDWCTVVNVVVF